MPLAEGAFAAYDRPVEDHERPGRFIEPPLLAETTPPPPDRILVRGARLVRVYGGPGSRDVAGKPRPDGGRLADHAQPGRRETTRTGRRPRERVVDLGPDDAEQRVMERLRVQIGHGAPSVWIAAAIHCRALLSASSLISSSQPFSSSSTPSTMPALISGM